jgi:[FeFe] hydrogenase (group B1/B3)
MAIEIRDNATHFRREILVRLARLFVNGKLVEEVDRIPVDVLSGDETPYRCCVYKERAILRTRCLAALGFRVEEDDEFTPLSEYARRALAREKPSSPVMTVLDIACNECVPSRYVVTELCQSCLARSCAVNCPFGAIDISHGRARIDPEKCKNCGRCKEACPYQAIMRCIVPCEEACPVGAIHKGKGARAEIDFDKCVSCGRCMRACPFGAVMERSQIIDILQKLKEAGKKVVAMVAPAIAGQFPGTVEQVVSALKQLGFSSVIEVAVGADITTRNEAKEFIERMERGDLFMTTSCCPGYIETVRRHVPELAKFVSDTATPMHYTAELAKQRDPDCITVFVGPCVAKRYEGMNDPMIDYVMTFEELGALFVASDIEVANCEQAKFDEFPSLEGRGFAITGGVAAAVKAAVDGRVELNPVCINGIKPAMLRLFKTYPKGKNPGNLIEMMTCEGGCVAGAGVLGNPKQAAKQVTKFSEQAEHIEPIPMPNGHKE